MNIFRVKYDNMLISEKLYIYLRKVNICLRHRASIEIFV
ncbi:hypothetical protein F383_28668 [Gossypium arboreum]|uniref:Uncharacterized protein n=1 Tax=Gossypium arboreum TaxID=29729 RepID=A0A0B0PFZ9_GOSAR|nr:hypothetical protein F383_28668 [Gossypium arboreum]